MPQAFFGCADTGPGSLSMLRVNREDLDRVRFRQRVLREVSRRGTFTTVLDERVVLPIAFAPIGMGGMQHGHGEVLAARAAAAAGVPYTLGTLSISSHRGCAAAVEKPIWFQLYAKEDRDFARLPVERVIAAQCCALVLTADLQAAGQRHSDIKNGLSVPPKLNLGYLADMARAAGLGRRHRPGGRRTFRARSG